MAASTPGLVAQDDTTVPRSASSRPASSRATERDEASNTAASETAAPETAASETAASQQNLQVKSQPVSQQPVSQQPGPYAQCVCVAQPEPFWDFGDSQFRPLLGELSVSQVVGQPGIVSHGPAAPEFPLFNATNNALQLDGVSHLRFDDPGDNSLLDFSAGESISLEAWVRIDSIAEGAQVYVVGKGRTQNPGQAAHNQNYALRLRGVGGLACVSFLYRSASRDAQSAEDGSVKADAYAGEFHRWNSTIGFQPDGLWHHVAVSHTFGSQQPPQAWVDGQLSDGTWDMGEKTFPNPPVVDNDQLWIGSSMGGSSAASIRGLIDEVAIFRRRLTDREISERFQTTRPSTALPEMASSELPEDAVIFDVRENVSLAKPWDRQGTRITMQWQQPVAAVSAVPKKYIVGGLIGDRTNPYVLRMRSRLTTPTMETNILIRSRSSARLIIDGQVMATIEQTRYATDGHADVREPVPPLYPQMHPVPTGDQETVLPVTLTAGPHVIELETVVGGKGMRVENSEVMIALGSAADGFQLLSPAGPVVRLDEASWRQFADQQKLFVRDFERAERRRQDVATARYWNQRHQSAQQMHWLPSSSAVLDATGIDDLIAQHVTQAGLQSLPVVDDLTFLKRLALNTVGVVPSGDEVVWFLSQPEADRRSAAIDRFLDDDRWADHWTSYWQDVLAENPGILKPELNNSGPFRWWIYESFLDNKATDRFATELIMMKGSRLGGGPAGFAMASQNDVPFAERALVLASAFNGRDMKCARCHDSPVNEFSQEQLFAVAAMVNRGPIKLPATSTVPPGPNGERSALIKVSLEPGAVIQPKWPFAGSLTEINAQSTSSHRAPQQQSADQWDQLLQNPADSREQAALHLTHPVRSQFAEVMVNRLWSRLFGRDLLPDAEDWDGSHDFEFAELLSALAQQHIASGYDLKSTAKVIINSQTWQRQVAPADSPLAASYAAQTVQRMTAEQMVDSLYAVVGKSFDSELLTLDSEGRRPESSFLNLGAPTRAWQFCSLSNERDRPALALPRAQAIYDLLVVFGWRDSRPQSINQREQDATVLQPLTLANGTAGRRLIQLSDGAIMTELAVNAKSPEQLVTQMFRQVLSRSPSPNELAAFSEELRTGFDDRLIATAVVPTSPVVIRDPISLSNHLHTRATEIKQQIEAQVRAGDAASVRLQPEWRIRAEDVLWVLLNSPEFAFVP